MYFPAKLTIKALHEEPSSLWIIRWALVARLMIFKANIASFFKVFIYTLYESFIYILLLPRGHRGGGALMM